MTVAEKIVCIFCGQRADIVKQDNVSMAICNHCNQETELSEYKKMIDLWLASI